MKKQYQGMDRFFSSNKENKNENVSLIKEKAFAKILTRKKENNSNVIYSRYSFYSYSNNKKIFNNLSQ